MTYTIHIGDRDSAGWLPEAAREDTRVAASARARQLLADLPYHGAELRHGRRLVESYVKRHPTDTGIGLPRGRRLYYNGIRRVLVDAIRQAGGASLTEAPNVASEASAEFEEDE